MKTGIATMPLDYGKCPTWLFNRMKILARGITIAIVKEFGAEELLRRLSNPTWFQSFGCVLGFDYNSSGLTTITLGALKAGLFDIQDQLGIYICGGKRTSRKTPEEIEAYGISRGFSFTPSLIFASKIAAKVDSNLIQDGFSLYHHNFIFTKNGQWCVVQQGMAPEIQKARRYHWLSSNVIDFVEEPHTGIISDIKLRPLNLTAKQSKKTKEVSTELVKDGYNTLIRDLQFIKEKQTRQSNLFRKLDMPGDDVLPQLTGDLDFTKSKYLEKILYQVHEQAPENFEQILMTKGVGPMTIRALSLVSELIYGAKPSYEDPARYSFAHGGKNGVPRPIDVSVLDSTIEILEKAVRRAKIENKEKKSAFERLQSLKLP